MVRTIAALATAGVLAVLATPALAIPVPVTVVDTFTAPNLTTPCPTTPTGDGTRLCSNRTSTTFAHSFVDELAGFGFGIGDILSAVSATISLRFWDNNGLDEAFVIRFDGPAVASFNVNNVANGGAATISTRNKTFAAGELAALLDGALNGTVTRSSDALVFMDSTVTVDLTVNQVVQAIPAPAGMGLLGAGLVAAGLMTRRRARVAPRIDIRSGAPSVHDVARPAPGCHHDQIEAYVEPGQIAPARQERLGGARDSCLLARAHRPVGANGGMRLDLDEHHHAAAPRDQVDLAERVLLAPGQDGVAGQTEPERGQTFAAPATRLGGDAAGPCHRRRASARA